MRGVLITGIALALLIPSATSAAIIGRPANNIGLVAYWSMNEGSGTDIGDASGRHNTGTFSSAGGATPQWTAGKFSKAVQFASTGAYIDLGQASDLAFSGSFSVSAWIQSTSTGQGGIFARWYNTNGNRSYRFFMRNSGDLQLELSSDGTNTTACTSNTVINDGSWKHVVAIYNASGGTAEIYVNGILDSTACNSLGNSLFNNNAKIQIGTSDTDTQSNSFVGKVDQVRVYNRTLTSAQVQALYTNAAASIGSSAALGSGNMANGLVGLWTFDGADVSDKVYDKSGNGNNAYYTGGATSSAKISGKIGQALSFNGSSNFVDTITNAGVSNTSAFTLAGWFYSTAATNDQVLIATGIDTSPFDGVWLQWGSSSPCGAANILTFVIVNSSGNEEGVCSSATLAQNRWYHFVATYDGSQTIAGMKLYIDGAPETIGTQTNNGFGSFTDRPWRFGKDRHTNPSTYFSGKMDDVRVYNRTLSVSEVKQLYNLGIQKVNTSSGTTGTGGLNSGLAGHWTFDGADITSSIADKSGNGRVGYYYASPTSSAKVIGKLGQALRFDGSTNYVDVGSISITGAITLSAWVKFSDLNCSSGCDIVANYNTAGDTAQYEMSMVNGEIGYSSASGGSFPGGTTNTTPITQTNRWYHLVVTRNATAVRTADTVSVYVDGVPQTGSFTTATPPGASFGRTSIGRDGELNDPQFNFPGVIDDVRIYSRDLSAAEVKQLYNLGR